MKLLISHTSTLRVLRHYRETNTPALPSANIRSLSDCISMRSVIEQVAPSWLLQNNQPIDILVGSATQSSRSAIHKCHVATALIPARAFYAISENVYAAGPELAFVQAAYTMPFMELLLLGMELCGTYTLHANETPGFTNCAASTTVERLAAFAKRAHGMRGAAAAMRATKFLIDGANSPAEASLALYLCLPPRYGGYGLPMPQLNPTTALGVREQRIVGQRVMRCDLHWVKQRVVVEYNSSQEHLTARAAEQDARRANTLEAKHIKLFTVTPKVIASPGATDALVIQLARALDKRLAPAACNNTPQRSALRTKLFPWLVIGQP